MSAAARSGATRTGKRFSPAGLGFVLTVLAEVLVFIGVGHLIGYGWAFLALFGLSAIGLVLFIRATPRAFRQFRAVAANGERPGPELTRHIAGLVGAVLIALPGFLTALAGAALFLPPVRKVAGKAVTGFATRRMSSAVAGDLFGPRRVRVKVGKVTPASSSGSASVSEPIEGEILDR